jgi:hypothetical protein
MFVDFGQLPTPEINEAEAENFFSGAIEKHNPALQVRGQESATHGVDDVFRKILEFEQLFALFFEFDSFAAEGLREKTCQVSNSQKTKQIAEKPDAESFSRGYKKEGARNLSHICQHSHPAKDGQTYTGGDKRYTAGKQYTGHNNDEEIEGDEVAFLKAGGVNESRDYDYVSRNL